MKKQPYPLIELTGGLNVGKDPMFLIDKESPNLQNVRFHEGLLRKDVGFSEFGNDLPLEGVPMFMDTFYKYDGSAYDLIITTEWIYEYDGTAETYTKRNSSDFDSGAVSITFADTADVYTITRNDAGSFADDGFAEGDSIVTDSEDNSGPFTIESINVAGDELTVVELVTDEGPDDFTVYHLLKLTGGEDNAFSTVLTFLSDGSDAFFITNGIDTVKYWTGDGLFQDTTFYAKTLATFKSRLILGFTVEDGGNNPTRIKWSALGDPLDFTSTGSGQVEMVDTPDWITTFVNFKDRLFVIKERSIWELSYVGGVTYFIPVMKLDGIGSVSPNSCMSLGENIIFFGSDNIYTYDSFNLTPLGDQLFPMLYDTEKKIIASTYLARANAIYVEELAEYWLTLPTVGERTSKLFKYSFQHKAWTIKDIEVSALGYYLVMPKPLWRELTGDWSEQTWTWMDRQLPSGAPTTLLGTPDGYIYEDDRITRDNTYMAFETKDFVFDHAQRWAQVNVEAKGDGDFSISYSTDQGTTWSDPTPFSPTTSFRTFIHFINVTSKSLRVKIESYGLDLTIKWIEPWYIPRAKLIEWYSHA